MTRGGRDGRRRHLGDVGRGDDGCRADAETPDDAPERQVPHAEGESAADRADDEQEGRDEHDPDASVAVRDAAGEPGADRAADERRCDREAEQERSGVELLADRAHRAVDDGGVEAEQEAAEGGGRSDQNRPG